MEWYYAEGTEQRGPVSAQEVEELFKAGKITRKTLVWREGMEQWEELGAIAQQEDEPEPKPEPVQPAQEPEILETEFQEVQLEQKELSVREELYRCSECSREFPEDEVISYDGAIVCAECKPVFMMKLKQGMQVAGDLPYAGFGVRFMAKIIDLIIMGLVQTIIIAPVFSMMGFGNFDDPENVNLMLGIMGLSFFLQTIIPVIYSTWFVGKYAATPGKMICKIKIIRSSQEKVSYGRALGRAFGEWISGSIMFLGYLIASFDEQKRTLHDRLCDTLVIHKD